MVLRVPVRPYSGIWRVKMNKPLEQFGTAVYVGDGISLSLIVGTLANVLPSIAAFLAIVWTCLRIYETCTVQKILFGVKCKPGRDDG